MSIPTTKVHEGVILNHIERVLYNSQRGLRRAAEAHKTIALARSSTVQVLADQITKSGQLFVDNLQMIIDLRANSQRETRLQAALITRGWSVSDIADIIVPLRLAAIAYRDAPKNSYPQIITACDSVIANVDAPDSLWPDGTA